MHNIENTYDNYDELLARVGKEVVESRITQLNTEMTAFLKNYKLEDSVYIHQMALTHALMDYFSDIQRLKDYQKIEYVNEIKIKAYETFWLLKRKPLQLKKQLESDEWLYVNEKFLLTRMTSFMLQDNLNVVLNEEKKKAFTNFLDTFYYYLKFRRTDAQAIELMLLAFQAGILV